MNEFERLLAFMKISYHNLTTLHRHLTNDVGWFGNHEKLGEWYDEIGEQIDDLAEIGLSLGYTEPSIKDAVLEFSGDVLASESRDLKASFKEAHGIMRAVAGMMKAAETVVPPDVQNKLQEYEYDWNKTANYMLAQALGKVDKKPIQEDED